MIDKLRHLAKKYTALWTFASFAIGALFGGGSVWKYAELQVARAGVAIEKLRTESEVHGQLRQLQADVFGSLLNYVVLRDELQRTTDNYALQNEFQTLKEDVRATIARYNRLEAKLSQLEKRQPRWFNPPIPPMAVRNVRASHTVSDSGTTFAWTPPAPDPLAIAICEDLLALYSEYGQLSGDARCQ